METKIESPEEYFGVMTSGKKKIRGEIRRISYDHLTIKITDTYLRYHGHFSAKDEQKKCSEYLNIYLGKYSQLLAIKMMKGMQRTNLMFAITFRVKAPLAWLLILGSGANTNLRLIFASDIRTNFLAKIIPWKSWYGTETSKALGLTLSGFGSTNLRMIVRSFVNSR